RASFLSFLCIVSVPLSRTTQRSGQNVTGISPASAAPFALSGATIIKPSGGGSADPAPVTVTGTETTPIGSAGTVWTLLTAGVAGWSGLTAAEPGGASELVPIRSCD